MTVNKVVHLVNTRVGFFQLTDQRIVLVELFVLVDIGIDFKYRACQLVFGIVGINLRCLHVAANMLVDDFNLDYIFVLANCHGINSIVQHKACGLFNLSDIPSAVRDIVLAKAKTAVLGCFRCQCCVFLCEFYIIGLE